MSETEAEPEPVTEPGSPSETRPTPSLPSEEPGPAPRPSTEPQPEPAPDPRQPTPGLQTALITAADLDVETRGSGERVVLVHGSIVGAKRTWRKQLDLAERWTLVLPNRPGFAGSPPLERGDFEAEAPLFAELLGDGAHLVGHSYGAVIALLAAARRPDAVRSLVVSEPGCFNAAAGRPHIDEVLANGEQLYAAARAMEPREFLLHFRAGVHSAHETPDELPGWLERGARHVMHERPPWEADVPLDALASAPFPKLVISGDHSPAFETLCDVIAERIGARRATVPGRAHTIPATGAPYNELLEDFLRGR